MFKNLKIRSKNVSLLVVIISLVLSLTPFSVYATGNAVSDNTANSVDAVQSTQTNNQDSIEEENNQSAPTENSADQNNVTESTDQKNASESEKNTNVQSTGENSSLSSNSALKNVHENHNVPIIDITLNAYNEKTKKKITLSDVNNGSKDTKYEGNDFQMTTLDGAQVSASNLEVKGRGNSTWTLAKKPYQIKFNKKTDLLGMGSAKKWVLLANYTDQTYLRNDLALSTAESIGIPGTKAGKPVELYVDGQYIGLYYLVHKVEIGKSTLNLKNNDAVLMEIDNLHGADGDPEFYSSIENTHFVMKEANDENNEQTYVNQFRDAYNRLEKDIYEDNWSAVSKEIDIDSFAKYYLLTEFSANSDGSRSSWYMYRDGNKDVIHCGPAWDYDLAFGNTDADWNQSNYLDAQKLWTYNDKAVSSKTKTPEILTRLMDMPQFRTYVEGLYQKEVSSKFQDIINSIDTRYSTISQAAEKDRDKWHSGAKPDSKKNYLKSWMIQRKAFMDVIFAGRYLPKNGFYSLNINGKVIDDCRIKKQSDDSYVIYASNGKVLDVTSGSIKNGTNVQNYAYNGTRAQKWCFYKTSNNQFVMMSECNNLFLTNDKGTLKTKTYSQGAQNVKLEAKKKSLTSAKITKEVIGNNEVNNDPEITLNEITLEKDQDYTLTKKQSGSTITYTISGIGNYTGSKSFTVQVIGNLVSPDTGYYEIESSVSPSKVLDINGSSVYSKANLQIYESNKTWAQHFEFVKNNDGSYTIFDEGSRDVIDVAGGNQKNGTNVWQYDANHTKAQKWYICDNGDGTVTFRSALNTDMVIDVAGAKKANKTNVQIYQSNGTAAQKFKIIRSKGIASFKGINRIKSSINQDKVVDVSGGSKIRGANVQIWSANGTEAQNYKFNKLSDGSYKITNTNSNKVLDVMSGSRIIGANVWQWNDNGSNAQKWILIKEGKYTVLRSKCSGHVLDLSGAITISGNNIHMWSWNNTAAQKWIISK